MSHIDMDNESNHRTNYPVMSKTRFAQIERAVKECINNEDVSQQLIDKIKDIMKFDPEMKRPSHGTYDDKKYNQIKEYRERKKTEGISTYVSSGRKASYYKGKSIEAH